MKAFPKWRLHESVAHWIYDPNVVGLDMRYKVVGGRETREWAICVQVLEKKPISALTERELHIPPTVETLTAGPGSSAARGLTPTDVIEVEAPLLHQGFEGMYDRPAWGGLGIGIRSDNGKKMLMGTMTVADWGGVARIFSAGHVFNTKYVTAGMPDRNKVNPAAPIYQPPAGLQLDPPGKWRSQKMQIGVMENGYPLFRYPANQLGPYYFNTYDLAWAIPRTGTTSYAIGPGSLSPIWPQPKQSIRISNIDSIPQATDLGTHGGPAYGLQVAFAGVMTGLHEGRVRSVHSIVKTWGDDRRFFYCFRDLIRVDPTFGGAAAPGDSGAMLVALGSKAGTGLGIMVGGNRSTQSVYFARIPTAHPGNGPLRQPNYAPGPDPPPEGGTRLM
ncbi:hypothetical protein [Streptomyces sp. NPDC048428]|uniref:hypothetical protein n=1 Tax=Streptomyces sp. NPDC048428 TaxID=3154503 RepID=UPI00342CD087